eukprot:RCo014625
MANPFECPICFELYDEHDHLPTTLPCGHSCCLVHSCLLRNCFSCRAVLPERLHPSFALRDGALLYRHLVSTIRAAGLVPAPEGASQRVSSPASALPLAPQPQRAQIAWQEAELVPSWWASALGSCSSCICFWIRACLGFPPVA